MIKPFDMTEVELVVEQESNRTFSGYMKQIQAEKEAAAQAIVENKEKEDEGMEEEEGEEGESKAHEASESEEQEEQEHGEDEDSDLEDAKEAVMNVVSLTKKDLEKLEESDPDLYEELEDFAKKVCKYEEKEEEKED